jgi:hypothetical protein
MVASGLLEVALAKLRTMQMRDTATLYYSIRSYFIHHQGIIIICFILVQNGTEWYRILHTGTGTAYWYWYSIRTFPTY